MLFCSTGATLIQDDASYFRRRAVQEQVAAQRATCDAARRCHDELAAAYRFRAATLPKPLPLPGSSSRQDLSVSPAGDLLLMRALFGGEQKSPIVSIPVGAVA